MGWIVNYLMIPAVALLLAARPDSHAGVPAPAIVFSSAEPREALPGGDTTQTMEMDAHAFSRASANMTAERRLRFRTGKGYFKRVWTAAPASNHATDGLGPLYNARACQSCHPRNGRGRPPGADDGEPLSMLLRLSIPPRTDAERDSLVNHRVRLIPEPTYGYQLQDRAIQDITAEGRMAVTYQERPVRLGDAETAKLRQPSYSVNALGYGPMAPEALFSARVAPQLIGLGLLEAIAEVDILSLSDPEDTDEDGISGRPNLIWSPVEARILVGRFGWKAGTPSVDELSQQAFAIDMGISVPLHPAGSGDCTERQTACRAAPDGNSPRFGGLEAGPEGTELVAFYVRNLAVPMRRDHDDPWVLAGKALFYSIGCTDCHHPAFQTPKLPAKPEQSGQLIWPYTDLLLHDMGKGLADGSREGSANGREWRTAPLWGVGLIPTVNKHSFYLNDGRARNLQEAILWHGGEARRSRDAFADLSAAQRRQLLRFVESL